MLGVIDSFRKSDITPGWTGCGNLEPFASKEPWRSSAGVPGVASTWLNYETSIITVALYPGWLPRFEVGFQLESDAPQELRLHVERERWRLEFNNRWLL